MIAGMTCWWSWMMPAARFTIRADAAFAKPEIYETLEERGVKYAIRIPANDSLQRDIEELLTRAGGETQQKPLVEFKGFLYQAGHRRGRCWLPCGRWSSSRGSFAPFIATGPVISS